MTESYTTQSILLVLADTLNHGQVTLYNIATMYWNQPKEQKEIICFLLQLCVLIFNLEGTDNQEVPCIFNAMHYDHYNPKSY